ncbi:MAG: NADH-quinone oxidoreductase subunit NuoK [Phycisphaerae bacterium]|nr:NADH-quinone oxidoreductase subunit NuoK [Phycisphaerae bacterium]
MAEARALMAIGAVLFGLGVVGFLTRRNLIIMFLSTEVMFQGVLMNLVAMGLGSRTAAGLAGGNLHGQVFGLFVLVIAAVEAGLGLAIVVMLYRRRGTLDAEDWRTMRG